MEQRIANIFYRSKRDVVTTPSSPRALAIQISLILYKSRGLRKSINQAEFRVTRHRNYSIQDYGEGCYIITSEDTDSYFLVTVLNDGYAVVYIQPGSPNSGILLSDKEAKKFIKLIKAHSKVVYQ